jgi:tetratricopeptide (TPR) repeat protein
MPKSCLCIVLLLASMAWGDVLILKDGTRLEGDVKRGPDGWTITTADGKTRTVKADAVKTFELGSAANKGTMQPAEGLASLRRSTEAVADINQIIDRYQKFIDNTKDAKVLSDAQADLDQWQARKEQGLVKHGNKWIAPEEVTAIAIKATIMAKEARELMRQNRNREADQLLQQAVAEDPQNPAAQYLRGVALFRMDKIPDSRKAFEIVNSVVPAHPPTLNNLAVCLARQNAHMPALNYYDQAMQASGVNKYILDNVAEALGSIAEEQRKQNVYAKCLRRFSELDLLLQQQLQPQGLYRWGGGWINQKQLDDLKTAEREVRDRLNALQQDFDRTNNRITEIDNIVAQNERTMSDLRQSSVHPSRDRDGRVTYVPVPLPASYYELQNTNRQLRSEQEQLRTTLTQMQAQAQRVRQQVPVPKFTGVQQIVGVEGMPEADAPAPSTMPTTSLSNDQ